MENTAINMPVLALRGLTIFPECILSFDVEREISIRALERAMEEGQQIFLVAQRELTAFTPGMDDLFHVGTISAVRQILRISEGSVRVMMEGRCRARLRRLWQTEPYLQGNVEPIREIRSRVSDFQLEALLRQTYSHFSDYASIAPRMSEDVAAAVLEDQNPGHLADYIAQNIPLRHQDRQMILEECRPVVRLRKINELLVREVEVLSCEQELESKIRRELGEAQRDHIIREQIRLLQRELGEDEDSELTEYRQKIEELGLPEDSEVEKKLLKEVDRLAKQAYSSAEAAVIRNYLDVCLEVPWYTETKARASIAATRRILDRDHFGLEKVKERILELVAVRQLNPEARGKIICLVGPPGVGKTSIAISVAEAMGRKLARLSLGGVRDEAEIRGHRKTYVGAMPGRIVNAIIQSGSMNPLLLLDEIDKLGNDYRGDPASALLEVLDSEQNKSFRDHFLELPLDLSRVLFITTANTTSTIPRPLLDRMEVIELASYTDEEKLEIARRYLLPKQMKESGLKKGSLRVSPEAIRELITGYTKESGVRNLERELGRLCRKAAIRLVRREAKVIKVTPENLTDFMGVRRYLPPSVIKNPVGLVNGLAWTEAGGELLEVEVNVMEGAGKLELTGNLGDVMKESAHAALSCIRSRAVQLGIDPEFYKSKDIHVHFPEGAVPKDGPSAGAAITTAMVSALTGQQVRSDVAMTGEVTLRGRVLAIGGLKEKTMAAKRSGIRTVIIPKENQRDLEEIDPVVREALRFVAVETMDAVLGEALLRSEAPAELEGEAVAAFIPLEPAQRDAGLRQ
ncbi:MAG: endopeptidase La [Oscillospiraceae bacterium]|nr:endopeptidase La [Oscillospiraceae bacterium]MCI8877360.1 endopeptidase La [Oscillospiraceae bacterium]